MKHFPQLIIFNYLPHLITYHLLTIYKSVTNIIVSLSSIVIYFVLDNNIIDRVDEHCSQEISSHLGTQQRTPLSQRPQSQNLGRSVQQNPGALP